MKKDLAAGRSLAEERVLRSLRDSGSSSVKRGYTEFQLID
jgi:hypothetical protein